MAFCSNCGNRLDDDAKFCNKCGKPLSSNLALHSPSGSASKNSLRSYGYSNRKLNEFIYTIIGVVAIIFISVYILNGQIDKVLDARGWITDEMKEAAKKIETIRDIMVVVLTVYAGEIAIKCFQVKKNYLSVSDDYVTGEACPSFGFGTVNFNHPYENICSARTKGETVIIEISGGKKYYFFIENAKQAGKSIRKKIKS